MGNSGYVVLQPVTAKTAKLADIKNKKFLTLKKFMPLITPGPFPEQAESVSFTIWK